MMTQVLNQVRHHLIPPNIFFKVFYLIIFFLFILNIYLKQVKGGGEIGQEIDTCKPASPLEALSPVSRDQGFES